MLHRWSEILAKLMKMYNLVMSSKMRVLIVAIVLSLPFGYLLYSKSTHLEPTGMVREVSSSGEIRTWQLSGVTQNALLRFTFSSGTSSRMLSLFPTNKDSVEGGWSDVLSDYQITTSIGSENMIVDLSCDRYKGQIKTSRAYVTGQRELFGNLASPRYSGDLYFHCTNPAAIGSVIEGELHFKNLE